MHYLPSLLVMAVSASAATQTVMVGKGGLTFSPDSITAAIGDKIEFMFESSGHSVAEGDFTSPCQPSSDTAFYSGFVNPGSQPFTVTINSTDPIWYFCSQVSHCQSGMVGVINPPAGQTAADYATAAGKTSSSKSPSKVQGGVFGSSSSGGSSASSTASSSPAASTSSSSGGGYGKPSTGGVSGHVGLSIAGVMVSAVVLGWNML